MIVYIVCDDCKLGLNAEDSGTASNADTPASLFTMEHTNHGHRLHIVTEPYFLETLLADGYKDVDRPDLEPIVTHFGGRQAEGNAKPAPYGKPGNGKPKIQIEGKTYTLEDALIKDASMDEMIHAGEGPGGLNERIAVSSAQTAIQVLTGTKIRLRPSWDETFLNVAKVLAQRGTCSRKHVGAVLVQDNRIVATGYNGAPSGMSHCRHDNYSNIHDDPDMAGNHCARAEHAERNVLIFANRIDTQGATMYITASPCLVCTRMMITAKIQRIVYGETYGIDRRVEELCTSAGITLCHTEFS